MLSNYQRVLDILNNQDRIEWEVYRTHLKGTVQQNFRSILTGVSVALRSILECEPNYQSDDQKFQDGVKVGFFKAMNILRNKGTEKGEAHYFADVLSREWKNYQEPKQYAPGYYYIIPKYQSSGHWPNGDRRMTAYNSGGFGAVWYCLELKRYLTFDEIEEIGQRQPDNVFHKQPIGTENCNAQQ